MTDLISSSYSLHFDEDDEDSSSGNSDLDEDYEKFKPGPIAIPSHKIVVIKANPENDKSEIGSVSKNKKRRQRRKKKNIDTSLAAIKDSSSTLNLNGGVILSSEKTVNEIGKEEKHFSDVFSPLEVSSGNFDLSNEIKSKFVQPAAKLTNRRRNKQVSVNHNAISVTNSFGILGTDGSDDDTQSNDGETVKEKEEIVKKENMEVNKNIDKNTKDKSKINTKNVKKTINKNIIDTAKTNKVKKNVTNENNKKENVKSKVNLNVKNNEIYKENKHKQHINTTVNLSNYDYNDVKKSETNEYKKKTNLIAKELRKAVNKKTNLNSNQVKNSETSKKNNIKRTILEDGFKKYLNNLQKSTKANSHNFASKDRVQTSRAISNQSSSSIYNQANEDYIYEDMKNLDEQEYFNNRHTVKAMDHPSTSSISNVSMQHNLDNIYEQRAVWNSYTQNINYYIDYDDDDYYYDNYGYHYYDGQHYYIQEYQPKPSNKWKYFWIISSFVAGYLIYKKIKSRPPPLTLTEKIVAYTKPIFNDFLPYCIK